MQIRFPILNKHDLSHFFRTGLLIMSISLLLTALLKYTTELPLLSVLSSSVDSELSSVQEFLAQKELSSQQELPLKQLQGASGQFVLTFDVTPWKTSDESMPDTTLLHLSEILQEQNTSAVFFLSDEWLHLYPDTAYLLTSAGHEVGYLYTSQDSITENVNDSSSYPTDSSYTMNNYKNAAKLQEERTNCMASGKEMIEKLTGQSCLFIRFHTKTDHDTISLTEIACKLDLISVSYSLDSEDWKGYSPKALSSFISHHPSFTDGTLIFFRCNSQNLSEALPSLLLSLQESDYHPVSLSNALWPSTVNKNR